jgi:hypothetical protein
MTAAGFYGNLRANRERERAGIKSGTGVLPKGNFISVF